MRAPSCQYYFETQSWALESCHYSNIGFLELLVNKNVIYKKLKYYQDRLENSDMCLMLKDLTKVQIDFIQEFLEKRLANTENIKNERQFFTIQYVLANMSIKSAYLEPEGEEVDVIPISGGRLIYA